MKKKGIGCSSGFANGQAFLITSNYNISNIPEFSILIVKRSSPEYILPLMYSKGIICETGGRMSHLAILCRELGKPCVSGIENIYSTIKNGDNLQIDGNTGEILINE